MGLVQKQIIYCDNSATTKPRAEVVGVMNKMLEEDYGNPSSLHSCGRKAKHYIEDAREQIANVINAAKEQIIFTSGGTEANNLVIFGVAKLFEELKDKKEKHLITTKIEHPSIKEPFEYLEKSGWNITWLDVDKEGFVDINSLEKSITSKTVLVSVIHANNEIGTIQDVKKVASICKKNNVLFHIDAVQSFGKIPLDVVDLDIDFVSLSSHKIYGPKGSGALFVKNPDYLKAILLGGGQEENLRAGTENVLCIAGFGLAAKLISEEILANATNLRKYQVDLIEKLSSLNSFIFTGPSIQKIKQNLPDEKYLFRLPGHVSIASDLFEGESLVLQADLRGLCLGSGSACSSNKKTSLGSKIVPSHVLLACGFNEKYSNGSLRITFGRENSARDISSVVEVVKSIATLLALR